MSKKVLITGAAHGLGKEIAKRFEENGDNLVLIDQDIKALEIQFPDQRHQRLYTDFSDPSFFNEMKHTLSQPDTIIFNAATLVAGYFDSRDFLDHRSLVQTNLLAPLEMIHFFYKQAVASKSRLHIVVISSISSFLGFPQASTYAASKAALSSFLESLYREIKDQNLKQIKLTSVNPSYIKTDLFSGAKTPLFTKALDPYSLSKKIHTAIKKEKFYLLEPPLMKIVPPLKGILSFYFWNKILSLFKIDQGMKTWNGREH